MGWIGKLIQVTRDNETSKLRIVDEREDEVKCKGDLDGEPFEGWIPKDEVLRK